MNPEEKLSALNYTMAQCRKSSFYRNRLPDIPLKSLDEIKKLPFTTKDDIRRNSPFGLLCVPKCEVYQYHETFGTTGTPSSTWLTKNDFMDLGNRINESGIGFTEEDIVLIRFPYAISSVAHFTQLAAQMKNACIIPASSRSTVSPFTRIVSLMQKLEVTVLASLPLQAVLIAETAELMGFTPSKDFPKLRAINTAGELLTPRRRKLIEDIWGVPVYDNYGMTEIGPAIVDCPFGVSHPLENYFIFEVLDENLENEVKQGEIGNLIVTTITKSATPLIRYITGDRARVIQKKCSCGQNRTFEIHGRKQDIIQAADKIIDIWDLEEILSNIPFGRFWVAGPMKGGIQFIIEKENTEDSVSRELIKTLQDKYNLLLKFDVAPKGKLYDRHELLSVGEVGKPQYIYSEQELKNKAYLGSTKN